MAIRAARQGLIMSHPQGFGPEAFSKKQLHVVETASSAAVDFQVSVLIGALLDSMAEMTAAIDGEVLDRVILASITHSSLLTWLLLDQQMPYCIICGCRRRLTVVCRSSYVPQPMLDP